MRQSLYTDFKNSHAFSFSPSLVPFSRCKAAPLTGFQAELAARLGNQAKVGDDDESGSEREEVVQKPPKEKKEKKKKKKEKKKEKKQKKAKGMCVHMILQLG